MTDAGVPPRRTPCFLSTLLSQKVPEKSDTELRCIISGQPKPEVTWYKNGQTIDGCGVSSYEICENQYTHVLHLYGCTSDDAAVYQVSAQNCFGMICCSAHIEVQSSPEDPQLPPSKKGDAHTGRKHETGTHEAGSAPQVDSKAHPYKEEERTFLGPPRSADATPETPSLPGSLQRQTCGNIQTSRLETPSGGEDPRQTRVAYETNDPEGVADVVLGPHSHGLSENLNGDCHRTQHSKVSQPTWHHLGPKEDPLNAGHQEPRVQKYISSSHPLPEVATSTHPGHQPPCPLRVPSEHSDSDCELCPEIARTYTEEFSDDDLEYLECSDVMTDYSNAVWQRHLQGTGCVFLLESHDEEQDCRECGWGGGGHFLREVDRGSQVSDNTGPMDATPGSCRYHSPPQEVGLRSGGGGPSPPHAGMTLTLGPHQEGTCPVTGQGRSTPAPASRAACVYPGIQGETIDSRQPGEEVDIHSLITMDKAPPETPPGELERAGTHPWGVTAAQSRVGEKDARSEDGEKPVRARRPGIKGKLKKPDSHPRGRTTEGTPDRHPGDPALPPRLQSNKGDPSHATAEATGLRPLSRSGEHATAEQDARDLQTPTASLPREGEGADATGEGVLLADLPEASRVPEESRDPQVQAHDAPSPMSTATESARAESSLTAPPAGTSASSPSDVGGTPEDSASSAENLDADSCMPSPQLEEDRGTDRADGLAGGPGGDLDHDLSISEAGSEHLSPRESSGHYPQHGHTDLHGLCSPDDQGLEVPGDERGPGPPQSSTGENARDGHSAGPPLVLSEFTEDVSQEAHEGAPGGAVAEGGENTSMLACHQRTCQERTSLGHSGGREEGRPLSPESNSLLQFEDDEERTGACAKDTTGPAARGVTFPREKPTPSTDGLGSPWVARQNEDAPAITMAPQVHPAKYHAAPVAENSPAEGEGAKECSPRAPDGNRPQHPSCVPGGRILPVSMAEAFKELSGLVPRAAGTHTRVSQLSEREGCCSDPPPQIGPLHGEQSQVVARVDHGGLQENAQEKGGETKQRAPPEGPPQQASPSEDGFQGSVPASTLAVQEEINSVPLDRSGGDAGGDRGLSSGLGSSVSLVAEAAVEVVSQALSSVLPLRSYLLEESKESQGGPGEAGTKLKILSLEEPGSESWPPTHPTTCGCEEPGAAPRIPNGVWALAEVLQADEPMGDESPSEMAAPASRAPCGCASALVSDTHGRQAGSSDGWRGLCPPSKSQLGSLESSVDPIGTKEACPAAAPPEASIVGGKDNASMSPGQVGNQPKVSGLAFLTPLLASPHLRESSVDPIAETDGMEWAGAERLEHPESTPVQSEVEGPSNDDPLGQTEEVRPALVQGVHSEESGETVPSERSTSPNPEDGGGGEATEQWEHSSAPEGVHLALSQATRPSQGGEVAPGAGGGCQEQGGDGRGFGEAAQEGTAEGAPHTLPPLGGLERRAQASVGMDTGSLGQMHEVAGSVFAEPGPRQDAGADSMERGRDRDGEFTGHVSPPGALALLPSASSPEGGRLSSPISNESQGPKGEEPHCGDTKPPNSPGSPVRTQALCSGEWVAENDPKFPQASLVNKSREEERPRPTKAGKTGARPTVMRSEEAKKKQETLGSGHLADGVKKKILSKVAALRQKLEEREQARKSSIFLKKIPKLEAPASRTDEKKDPKKPPCKRDGRAPVLLRKIQAEMFPDHSGNVRLSCQFAEIHEESTIWWTKDVKPIAQVQRSAGDHSTVSLAIVQASQKDQGLYTCCIKNTYGRVTAEFRLTAEVLRRLSAQQESKGCEEIEFSQLLFKEDFLMDSYFGGSLRGQIATEELHFGEGVHRKAFRSTVMEGLTPVFKPGHACVLKVHNAIAYGTRNNDELVQKNYNLAAQECYVQNTARYYAKIYAAEAQPLEGFGEVPEIIPIFLIHRPENNIPYATVEEELLGEFVKYSIRDGKEINFLRRESEAGQKCCTFQHWVYQKTSGCLLVTDMQGVGMKLTDVGIATLAKGYKGFKGNCCMSFIDQFKALHQCNKYCKMLGLKALQHNSQKPKKPSVLGKSRAQQPPNAAMATGKKTGAGSPTEKKA
ncbi:alpha-protein kinase 2 [Echinops telfairi]|uniref:Alpha-protein kinase 2 n=1 Tax=Echinops telfairi TaxID=9371 RepID=A0AC55DJR8_ECHTE|nr:alpha-protein kinase 2 [Echinops telfairi]